MFNADQTLIRQSKDGSFSIIKSLGFLPRTVIDVGVQVGTHELYRIFNESSHLLVEPVKEHEHHLQKICHGLHDARYIIAAARNYCGRGTLRVSTNARYASVQAAPSAVEDGYTDREIEVLTLDQMVLNYGLKGPYLIKIDVDGSEPLVIEGAKNILKETGYVLIEATLFGQIHRVIDRMREYNFHLYDILDLSYRGNDAALEQVDLAFVPEDSFLRKPDLNFERDIEKKRITENWE